MEENKAKRDALIVRTSLIGIVTNLLLAGFKAAAGLAVHSIAMVLDAVNNLSDVLSSVITVLGTKLAGKKADKQHPLGHGRIEYLSAMLVSAVVLYAGFTSLIESVKKMVQPFDVQYSAVSLAVAAVAVPVKLLLGTYVRHVGEKAHSGALTASGSDAFFDAVISLSVLLGAVLYLIWGVKLEAYIAAGISLVIIRAGYCMLKDTLDDLLGKRLDRAFLDEIRETICETGNVSGAYDLMLHSYGPDRYIGSVCVEVPDTMTARQIDQLEREIAGRVLRRHGVLLTGIGIYASDTSNEEVIGMRARIEEIISSHEGVLQVHGFYADPEKKTASVDMIIDFSLKGRDALFEHISEDIRQAYPEYRFEITLDPDF